eukprot:1070460-Ditylum_brightwellii.AAC.1
MAAPDSLLLQDFSCQAKLGIQKRNVNKASQDVAVASAPLDPQEEDPEYEPKGKTNKEDDLQKEN